QGPPGGTLQPPADRLCPLARWGTGARPGRAGPRGRAAGLRPVRALGHRQQGLAVPGAAPDPPGRTAAHRPESRPTGVAPALPDDPAEPAPPPDLCRRLLLRPPPDRPAPEAAGLPRAGADPGRRGGLLGAAAGPVPGLPLVGALPGQSATDRGASSAG